MGKGVVRPGLRLAGRAKGTPNKVTGTLKEAILKAAELVGSDGKGTDGLAGYLEDMARKDRKTYAGLLGRVIPHTLSGDPDNPIQVAGKLEVVIEPVRPAVKE